MPECYNAARKPAGNRGKQSSFLRLLVSTEFFLFVHARVPRLNMKILLFGQSGQLGWELQRSLSPLAELTCLGIESTDHCGDFTDPEGIRASVRYFKPDIIVNAGAHTAVDKAESEPALAHIINAQGPAVLAEEAARSGAWIVHYSTDYVFDGSGERPWKEEDEPNPLSVYGLSKLEGEQAVRAAGCKHLIFRTSWVYASRGGNFAKTMLRLGQEKDQLSVINDQIGAPTGADLLADVTAHAIRAAIQDPALGGLYHLCAAGHTSWHGYACFVLNLARSKGVALRTEEKDIAAVASSQFKTAATRPMNSRLDTTKLQNAFNLRLPPWQDGVRRMISEILDS